MDGRSSGAAPARRALTAAAAAGLLLPAAAGPARAQQSPAAWTQERRAVLPSGLTVQLDFSPLPGITAKTAPAKLPRRGSDSGYIGPSCPVLACVATMAENPQEGNPGARRSRCATPR